MQNPHLQAKTPVAPARDLFMQLAGSASCRDRTGLQGLAGASLALDVIGVILIGQAAVHSLRARRGAAHALHGH